MEIFLLTAIRTYVRTGVDDMATERPGGRSVEEISIGAVNRATRGETLLRARG